MKFTLNDFAAEAARVKKSPVKQAAVRQLATWMREFGRVKPAEQNNPRDLEREIKAREQILEKIKGYFEELEKNHPVIYKYMKSRVEEAVEPMEAEVFVLKIRSSLSGAGSEQIMK